MERKIKYRGSDGRPRVVKSVSQFTGLTDRNGREVYEGDVIRVEEYENLLLGDKDLWDLDADGFTLGDLKGDLRKQFAGAVRWCEGGFEVEDPWGMVWPLAVFFGDQRKSQPIFEIEVI